MVYRGVAVHFFLSHIMLIHVCRYLEEELVLKEMLKEMLREMLSIIYGNDENSPLG
jgi:hypothetical protein